MRREQIESEIGETLKTIIFFEKEKYFWVGFGACFDQKIYLYSTLYLIEKRGEKKVRREKE